MKKILVLFFGLVMSLWAATTYNINSQAVEISQDGDYIIQGNKNQTSNSIIVKSGKVNITLKNVNISSSKAAFELQGSADVTIILEGSNTLSSGRGFAGLQTGDNTKLTIDGSGSLQAKTDLNGGGAGIGGADQKIGKNITINGGIINIVGGNNAAGIGGGNKGGFENITITGGDISINSGGGASIGSGSQSSVASKNITISGGRIRVVGAYGAAAIGAGYIGGSVSNIKISGGIIEAQTHKFIYNGQFYGVGSAIGGTTNTKATGIEISGGIILAKVPNGVPAVGNGAKGEQLTDVSTKNCIIFENNQGKVHGEAVLNENLEIPKGANLEIPNNSKLTLNKNVTLINKGTLTNKGSIDNKGKITNSGKLENSGELSSANSIDGVQGSGALRYDISVVSLQITQKQIYDKNPKTPALQVSHKGVNLVENEDYTKTYSNNTDAGSEASVIIKAKGTKFYGTKSMHFTIEKMPITLTYPTASSIENGKTLSSSVLSGGDTQYGSFTFKNPNFVPEIGTKNYPCVFEPKSELIKNHDFKNIEQEISLEVLKSQMLAVEIKVIGTYTYNGKAHEPNIKVSYNGKILQEGQDYTKKYSSNVDAGDQALVSITGMGKFEGEKSVNFSIAKKPITLIYPTASSIENGKALKDVILTGGDTKYGSFAFKNQDQILEVGTQNYPCIFTPNENANKNYSFENQSENISFEVLKSQLSAVKIEVIGTYTYNGEAHEPSIKVSYNGKILQENVDYTKTYSSNVDAGDHALVTITGMGKFEGEKSVNFSIAKQPITLIYPTASSIEEGKSLGEAILNGGSVEHGSFAFKNPALIPEVGTQNYPCIFTPNENANKNYSFENPRADVSLEVTQKIIQPTPTEQITPTEQTTPTEQKPEEVGQTQNDQQTQDDQQVQNDQQETLPEAHEDPKDDTNTSTEEALQKQYPDNLVINSQVFTDVFKNNAYFESIKKLVSLGLMHEKGSQLSKFYPDMQMDRFKFTCELYRFWGQTYVGQKYDFTDINDNNCIQAFSWAKEENIFSGYSDSSFGASKIINVDRALVALYQYALSNSLDVSVSEMPDLDAAAYAQIPVKWAIKNSIVTDKEEFKIPLTKAKLADIFAKFIFKFGR